jgi:hypothetical protein
MADDKNTNLTTGGNNQSSPDKEPSEEAPVLTTSFNLPTGGNFTLSDPLVESDGDGSSGDSGKSNENLTTSAPTTKIHPEAEIGDEQEDGFQTDSGIASSGSSPVVPPKSTTAVNKLIDSTTSAVLTDKGIVFKDSTAVVKKIKHFTIILIEL